MPPIGELRGISAGLEQRVTTERWRRNGKRETDLHLCYPHSPPLPLSTLPLLPSPLSPSHLLHSKTPAIYHL